MASITHTPSDLALKALRVSEARYRRLFETARDGILILNADTAQIEDVNPYLMEMLGYTHAEFLGKKLWEVGAFSDIAQSKEMFTALQKEGYVRYHDLPLKTRAGAVVPVEFVSNSYDCEGIKVIQCNIRDISASKRAEETLRESEARFRSLTAMSSDFYWESDAEYRLTSRSSANEKQSPITLFREGKQFGQRRWEIPYLTPDESGWQAHRAALDAHLPFRDFELSRLADDNTESHIMISGDPVFDAAGNFKGYRGVGTNVTERKQAETALRRSEERSLAITRSAHDAVVTSDSAGNIVDWNPGAVAIFGYARSEVLVQAMTLLMPERYREAHLAGMERIRSGAEHRIIGNAVELTGLHKDGSEFPLELSLAKWEIGNDWFVTGIIRDIAERKRVEAQLRMLSKLVEQSPASIVITDKTGNIEYVNPNFEEKTGYTGAEVLGKNPRIFKSGKTAALVYDQLWVEVSRGGVWRGELCNRRKDGELYWEFVVIFGVKGESGAIEHYVAVKEDIDARKHAEDALRQHEQNLQLFIDHAPAALAMFDREMRYLSVSRRWLSDYGLGERDLRGLSHYDVFPEIPEHWREIHRRALAGEVLRADTDRFERADGSVQWLQWEVRPWYDSKGNIGGIVIFSEDLTERRRLEEVHLQAQKLESLGILAGGIAHDFNNILAAICGNADLAAEDVGTDHVAMESLDAIRQAGVRASELVRRIMIFGRPNQAKHDVVDLSEMVVEVLKLLRSTLSAGISLDRHFAKNTPYVTADAGQIHEVIVNLTTNAAYAIGRHAGSIAYRLEPVQVSEEFAQAIPGIEPGPFARLTITDSGCGMDAATVEHIFDAFYTTKPLGEGTGLGLSMVHGIMKNHGGAVTVESDPGKGSSFALYFPAAIEKAAKEELHAWAKSTQSAQRVLYVDDEQALVSLAGRVFARLGHSMSGFIDPRDALSAFRARPQDYDLVVTDLSMPYMSGFEFASEVLGVRPEIPVLMMSGNLNVDDQNNALTIGIREVIAKSITVNEFGDVLARLFDSPNAR